MGKWRESEHRGGLATWIGQSPDTSFTLVLDADDQQVGIITRVCCDYIPGDASSHFTYKNSPCAKIHKCIIYKPFPPFPFLSSTSFSSATCFCSFSTSCASAVDDETPVLKSWHSNEQAICRCTPSLLLGECLYQIRKLFCANLPFLAVGFWVLQLRIVLVVDDFARKVLLESLMSAGV